MDKTFWMTYGIPVLGAGIIIGFIFLLTRRVTNINRRKQPGLAKKLIQPVKNTKQESTEQPIEAFLQDDDLRVVQENAVIPGADVAAIKKTYGGLGKQYNLEGKMVYALTKHSRVYFPTQIPERMDLPQSIIFFAVSQPEIAITRRIEIPKNFIQKYGQIMLFVGAVLFLMVMWGSQR